MVNSTTTTVLTIRVAFKIFRLVFTTVIGVTFLASTQRNDFDVFPRGMVTVLTTQPPRRRIRWGSSVLLTLAGLLIALAPLNPLNVFHDPDKLTLI